MTGDLDLLVSKIRSDLGSPEAVPGFDPLNGNEQAKFLFLLEAPGPQALKTGKISFDNPDPSARNFKRQLEEAGVQRGEIAVWNIVPWYLGTPDHASIRAATGEDVRRGVAYLPPLLAALPRLEAIVLVGSRAKRTFSCPRSPEHGYLRVTIPPPVHSKGTPRQPLKTSPFSECCRHKIWLMRHNEHSIPSHPKGTKATR